MVTQGHHWFDQLAKGKADSSKEIARREETDVSDVGHNMQLAFLVPDIAEVVLVGRQSVELTSNRLLHRLCKAATCNNLAETGQFTHPRAETPTIRWVGGGPGRTRTCDMTVMSGPF